MPTSPHLPQLPQRRNDSHKGDFGSGLLIGGSRGMSGAIAMAGLSAARAGAGTVTLCVPDPCLETVAAYSPCLMTMPLAAADGKMLLNEISNEAALMDRLQQASCVAIGPGIGQSTALQSGMLCLLSLLRSPAVIDADGLNNLAVGQEGAKLAWSKRTEQDLVITPHPGEWSRLTGIPASDCDGQAEAAIACARDLGLTIVLKGHRTLITDGSAAVRNDSGTPAMSTGGSGDVLTGIITALICQGMQGFEAAQLGVWVHGKAGELASSRLQNSHVVLPTDLIDSLPAAFAAARASAG